MDPSKKGPAEARNAARKFGELATERLRISQRAIVTQPIWLGLLGSVVGAVLLYLIPLSADKLWERSNVLPVVIAVGCGVAFHFVLKDLSRHTRDVSEAAQYAPSDLYVRLDDAQELLGELRAKLALVEEGSNSTLQWSWVIVDTQRSVINFVREVRRSLSGRPDLEEVTASLSRCFRETVEHTLELLQKQRQLLLTYDLADIYFMEVFVLNGEELTSLACVASPDATHHGRKWTVPDGHIGSAVASGRGYLVSDLAKDSRLHQQHRETDDLYYRSTIAVPIPAADERTYGAHGAICVTSSRPDQFTEHHVVFVEILAQALAGLFYAAENAERRIADARA
jgi:hypothetical protein